MKKLCTLILVLILAMSVCLVSCDEISLGNGGGNASTEGGTGGNTDAPSDESNEDETDAPASEIVTDENGEVVTVTPGVETEIVTDIEIVTDENGEAVTDEAGEIVTEIVTDIVTVDPNTPDTEGAENDGNAPSPNAPVVIPAEKTPYAWYNAAYRTVSNLTNGTLNFKMIAVSGTYSNEMTATVKISGSTYFVQQSGDSAPLLYVDGVFYDVASKLTGEISEESFCDAYLPYYPLSNAMLPLTEEILDGAVFEEENGEVSFSVTITAEEFKELSGAISETMKDMVCTVTFDTNGVMMRAVYAASFGFVDEKTGEVSTSSSELSVALSELGTTAPIVPPEDAEEYETVRVEDSYDPTFTKPSIEDSENPNKEPVMTKEDFNENAGADPEGKDPSAEDKENDRESIYEEEIALEKDLNGDGVIGAPTASEDKVDEDERIYEKEIEANIDFNGDGVIGRPENSKNPDSSASKDEASKTETSKAETAKDEASRDTSYSNDTIIKDDATEDDKISVTVAATPAEDSLNP